MYKYSVVIEIPKTVYVYMDFSNPLCKWNFIRGVIESPKIYNKSNQSIQEIGFFLKSRLESHNYKLKLENDIETIRKIKFPYLYSRLNSLYFFETKQDAKNTAIESNGHFIEENLIECILPINSVYQKYDMNWITYYNEEHNNYSKDWIEQYWKGNICPTSKYGVPDYECLTTNNLIIKDTSIKQKYYNLFEKESGLSLPILQLSVFAFKYGYNVGRVCYFTKNNNGCIHIIPCINFQPDECAELYKRVKQDFPNEANIIGKNFNKYGIKTPNFMKYGYCITCKKPILECHNYKNLPVKM